jgi:hypothetical protein
LTNSNPLGCGQKDFKNDVLLNDVTCPSVTLIAIMDANKVKVKDNNDVCVKCFFERPRTSRIYLQLNHPCLEGDLVRDTPLRVAKILGNL